MWGRVVFWLSLTPVAAVSRRLPGGFLISFSPTVVPARKEKRTRDMGEGEERRSSERERGSEEGGKRKGSREEEKRVEKDRRRGRERGRNNGYQHLLDHAGKSGGERGSSVGDGEENGKDRGGLWWRFARKRKRGDKEIKWEEFPNIS